MIGIVRLPRILSSCAYRPEGSNALCTCQCISFESFTLKMKVKDVDDLDENWQTNVSFQFACMCKNGTSRFSLHSSSSLHSRSSLHLGPAYILGPAVCSQYIIVQYFAIHRFNCRVDLQNGQRWNVNMLMKRPYATLYSLAIAMFALFVIICEKFPIEICMTLTFGMGQYEI